MFTVLFLGPDALLPECRNRFCSGLEITAFSSAPTSKFDVGRLPSKRQCSRIFSIQQESLPCVTGMWHGCAKTVVTEQASDAQKSSLKSFDEVKQSQEAPTIQYSIGAKSSTLNSCRSKPPIRNFQEQLAVLERIHLQAQAPCNGPESSETVQVSHKVDISPGQHKENHHSMMRSENQSFKSLDTSFQYSLRMQLTGVNSAASCGEDDSGSSVGCPEKSTEPGLIGHKPVWNEPFSGVHAGQASKSYAFCPPLGSNEQTTQQWNGLRTHFSHHPDVSTGKESNEAKGESQSNAQEMNACQVGGQLHNKAQCREGEALSTRERNPISGSHSHLAAQLAGSVNGILYRKQEYGVECASADDEILTSFMVEGMQEMQAKEFVDGTSASCKVASVRMPMYRMATPLERSLSDSIFYLESLGVDCSRLFRDDPSTMKCTVKQLRTLVCALERHGLRSNDFGRIFNLCPKVLHLKPDSDLKALTGFLFDEAGLSRKDFAKVIRRCPRLLVVHIHEQLRPTLSFLRSLGYSKMGHVISNNPTLISFSVERKLIPKLRFLESLGFTYREAASMVVRFPAIFNYSITNNLQPKYDFLVHKMGGRNKDLLAFPQYFGYSLETRIRPRYECIAKLGVTLSIQAILKLSDAEFNARFLSGGGQECPFFALPESSNTVRQHCSLESVQFASLEHSEVRALVTV